MLFSGLFYSKNSTANINRITNLNLEKNMVNEGKEGRMKERKEGRKEKVKIMELQER